MSGKRPFKPNIPTILGAVKPPTSPRSFDPASFIKHNGNKNTYDICHVKKLIGKKLMVLDKGVLVNDALKQEANAIKDQLMLGTIKRNIIIHVMSVEGILRVIGGVSVYAAICTISYQDIKSNNLGSIELKVIQYPKQSQINVKRLIDYLK